MVSTVLTLLAATFTMTWPGVASGFGVFASSKVAVSP
jgi:hypothetical protein